jgi:hypothetical protein
MTLSHIKYLTCVLFGWFILPLTPSNVLAAESDQTKQSASNKDEQKPRPKDVKAPIAPPDKPPVAQGAQKPILFRGMDIGVAPAGNDTKKLTDIFDRQLIDSNEREKTYKLSFRKGVKVYKIKDNDPLLPKNKPATQTVYYISDKDVFYIGYVESIMASSVQFYGPFPGDPAKIWKLTKDDEVPQP